MQNTCTNYRSGFHRSERSWQNKWTCPLGPSRTHPSKLTFRISKPKDRLRTIVLKRSQPKFQLNLKILVLESRPSLLLVVKIWVHIHWKQLSSSVLRMLNSWMSHCLEVDSQPSKVWDLPLHGAPSWSSFQFASSYDFCSRDSINWIWNLRIES